MSKKTRRDFSAAFKAKVAIEALKEQETLASKPELPHTGLSLYGWKTKKAKGKTEFYI